uniref:Uncharacterized protein n=1 Tax=Triticum urartu TaxID=4572 RepID=A0A8R7QD40_TRIUA
SGGRSGSSDEWASLLHDAKPDDVEEIAHWIALRWSRLDPGGNGNFGSATTVTHRRSASDIVGPSHLSHNFDRSSLSRYAAPHCKLNLLRMG